MTNIISIKDIGNIINNSLPKTSYKMKIEVRQPKISNGHMYMSLKDNSGIINAIVWKNNINESIKNLKDGDMVEITGRIEYYTMRGSISIVISSIEKQNIVGDMFIEYELLKNEFEKKGYFNNKIGFPELFPELLQNIVILSSSNGAAIHDFYYVLDNNKSKIKRTLIDVPVQGIDSILNIIHVLNTTDFTSYDMIVITRGGGSMEDLWGFNNRELIESVYNCKIPIMAAIGHVIDTTIIDMVADISCPTPSLAAQYIVDHNISYISKLDDRLNKIKLLLINNISCNIKKLNTINYNNYKIKINIINKIENKIEKIKTSFINDINNMIFNNNNIIRKYDNISSEITILRKNNNVITSQEQFQKLLNKKYPFVIMWNNVKMTITDYNIV